MIEFLPPVCGALYSIPDTTKQIKHTQALIFSSIKWAFTCQTGVKIRECGSEPKEGMDDVIVREEYRGHGSQVYSPVGVSYHVCTT